PCRSVSRSPCSAAPWPILGSRNRSSEPRVETTSFPPSSSGTRPMPRRLLAAAALALGLAAHAADAPTDKSKKALQAFQEYVGCWNGNGGPDTKNAKAAEIWKESLNWSWKFGKNDVCLVAEFKNSKHFDKGELRFLNDKDGYQLTLVDKQQ